MNEAFLMKMLWNLTTKLDDLWCRVLYSKYGRNNDLRDSVSSQPYDSPLWKALAGMWGKFQSHVVKQIGDGNHTNFWLDKWGPNNVSLINFSTNSYVDTTITVKDMVDDTGNWDLTFLFGNLPSNIVNRIIALPAPHETDGPDVFGWGGTSSHNFSVRSAYDLITETIASVEGNWKALWKWKGPHQIQTFM
ncbi:putative ribonuclease H protein, partial [Trifolium medium]|nr:putative ribonuclease H protein [Trifolium medium]